MSHPVITPEQVEWICKQIEEQNAGYGLGHVQILWNFGKPMGKPKAWIEIVPGLFGLVFRIDPSKVIISYADAKRWIEPDWEMPLSTENPTRIFHYPEQE
jgi:hypothetical protein